MCDECIETRQRLNDMISRHRNFRFKMLQISEELARAIAKDYYEIE